ncbi:hypothetical protein LCGC14_0782660 [marine sediment metagenome]|uniref:Uncharacterized protein n=1 Tax=marine sediment metagenome TaxID=412755 RepID=A0A0F9QEW1_9ZZZZ
MADVRTQVPDGEVRQALQGLLRISNTDIADLAAHLADLDNPHQIAVTSPAVTAGNQGDFIDLITDEIAIPIVDADSIITSVTLDYTALLIDDVILVDASAGAVIITLPAAADRNGKRYDIKKIDATANTVTIDGNAVETIDDGLIAVLTTQYEAVALISDATEWWIMTYNPIPIKTEGGQSKAAVSDDDVRQLLAQIVVQLRTNNTYLALMNDAVVSESDTLEG